MKSHPPTFQPVAGWPAVPHGLTFGGAATAVAVSSAGDVYVFNRGPVPVMIFSARGEYLGGWGRGQFQQAHGITIDRQDNIYLVDVLGHAVEKRTLDGTTLWRIAGPFGASARSFDRPTDVAVDPATGEIFVSDGYGNSHVHVFSSAGEHITTWGESGSDPGQFSLPHGLAVLPGGRVAVCDRENFRVQVFSLRGHPIDQWHFHRPAAIRFDSEHSLVYVAEMGPPPFQYGRPNLGCRVRVVDLDGREVSRFGSSVPGREPDQFVVPHAIALGPDNSVYVAEVTYTYIAGNPQLGPLPPGEPISLRLWRGDAKDSSVERAIGVEGVARYAVSLVSLPSGDG